MIAEGDCFRWAYNFVRERHNPDDPKLRIVHATVHPDWHPRRYAHAWVEIRGRRVKDWQHHSGEGPGPQRKLSIRLEDFYDEMNPEGIVKYTFFEALKALSQERRETGKFHFGPWGA